MRLLPPTALLVAASWWLPGAAPAQQEADPEIPCNAIYMVQSGDSLSKIARRAYGRIAAYQTIFDYNPGTLTDPNRLPAGVGLYIPCLDAGAAPAAAPSAGDPELLSALPELPRRPTGPLKILTGSEYPPYVDDDLPNGGFSVELVERALLHDDGASDFRIDVIHDWSSHLEPLLADGAYALAFPWFRPDCSRREALGEHSRWRCDELRFSEPLHEVVVTFHARPETAGSVKSAADLEGMTLCRPRGYFTHDLEAAGLVPPTIERAAPPSPADCFEALVDGEVDVVTLNADTAERLLDERALREKVVELTPLASVQTLHVVAMKGDPRARVNLLRVDKGLIGLQEDGTYRKIADAHLRER